jgi:hypothetical protein
MWARFVAVGVVGVVGVALGCLAAGCTPRRRRARPGLLHRLPGAPDTAFYDGLIWTGAGLVLPASTDGEPQTLHLFPVE